MVTQKKKKATCSLTKSQIDNNSRNVYRWLKTEKQEYNTIIFING